MKFGDYLRQTREQKGWTQPEAAAKANIEQSYLSKLETGRSYPSEDIFGRLVAAFGIDTHDMTSRVFAAELDKLREISDVRAVILARQRSEASFVRGWLVAGLVMLMLGGGMLGLAYSTEEPQTYRYFYRSEGIILEDESPMVFQFLEAGVPDANKRGLSDRVDYAYEEHAKNRGDAYIVKVEGGYRRFSLQDIKPHAGPSLIAWHYAIGFMFLTGGMGCFYISRRWR